MIGYDLKLHARKTEKPNRVDLDMSCDNCGRQSKNRFLLWFLVYVIIVLNFCNVKFRFMITGHTKSHVDSIFGPIKRRLKSTDAKFHREIYMRIDESHDRNRPFQQTGCGGRTRRRPLGRGSNGRVTSGSTPNTFSKHAFMRLGCCLQRIHQRVSSGWSMVY